MTRRLRRIARAAVLGILLPASAIFAIRFPDVFFFPFTPGYSFALVSDKGNTIDVSTRITIPEEEAPNIFTLEWILKIRLEKQLLEYNLRFTVLTNGDITLSEMRDESSDRFFNPPALIFPQSLKIGTLIPLGESLSLRYVKKIASVKVGEKSYQNVVIADLVMGHSTNQVYFAQKNAIVGIKTPSETFRRR